MKNLEILALGMDCHLAEPIEPDLLYRTIQENLR